MAQTLYDKYGGFAAVSRVVMDFYDALLDSERVGDHFEDVDMPRLIDHQTKFMAYLLGGPADYTGERLRASHASLDIRPADFDELKAILAAVLDRHGFAAEDRDTVLAAVERQRPLIVAS